MRLAQRGERRGAEQRRAGGTAGSPRGPLPSFQALSAVQVTGPTTPSNSASAARDWKAKTARRVAGPNSPSTTRISRPAPAGSARRSRRCNSSTSSPRCMGWA
jgi:hypothetical protein